MEGVVLENQIAVQDEAVAVVAEEEVKASAPEPVVEEVQ